MSDHFSMIPTPTPSHTPTPTPTTTPDLWVVMCPYVTVMVVFIVIVAVSPCAPTVFSRCKRHCREGWAARKSTDDNLAREVPRAREMEEGLAYVMGPNGAFLPATKTKATRFGGYFKHNAGFIIDENETIEQTRFALLWTRSVNGLRATVRVLLDK